MIYAFSSFDFSDLSINAFVTSSYNNAAVTCFGSCDGSVQVSPAGGTAPYTYQWSSGSTTDTDQNLCAGIYSVEVTDINSCAFRENTLTKKINININLFIYLTQ